MSYHLEMEKKGIVPDIAMPPIQEKPVTQSVPEYDVHPDIAKEFHAHAQKEPAEEAQVEQAPQDAAPAQAASESKNERNIRVLRQKAELAERLQRERDELEMKLKQFESMQQPQKPEQNYSLNPDDIVEAKHLEKYDKQMQQLQKEVESYKYQASVASAHALLKAKYPDIDEVVSVENLAILKMDYPELAESVNSTTNLVSKGVTAYTLIKKLGIAAEDTFVEDKLRAQKNAAKPKSVASLAPQQGDSPLSKANAFANGLTDELKMQLRREMEAARRAL